MEKITKIAIIGASYLQEPLIQKAKARGYETHVFAWGCGDVGEKSADFFYPISIVEKEKIASICRDKKIDGVCSIASDLAAITVNHVANELGLIGNSAACMEVSTNKHRMRQCFEEHGDPSPRSVRVTNRDMSIPSALSYPVIVKPTDRSGSRGVTKLTNGDGLAEAIDRAIKESFEKCALIEEYATGMEYSAESISWEGTHHFITLTQKYTTGAPHFVETAHLEPACIGEEDLARVRDTVTHALDSLGIQYGASHSELKIAPDGTIKLIEIGGRMGGDNIGAMLVELSTGYDFVGAVLDVALGIEPSYPLRQQRHAAIRYICSETDLLILEQVKRENPEILVEEKVSAVIGREITESNDRFGYFVIASDCPEIVRKYMPATDIL